MCIRDRIGCVGSVIMTILNYRGAKASAIFQTTATVAMAIGGIAFFVSSTATGTMENLQPMFTDGAGFTAVVLAVPAMFVGFDVIPQAAEEMNIPLGKIGKVMIIAIVMAATWYIIMILATALSTPGDVLAGYNADPNCVPVANAWAYAMGSPVFGKIMIIAAMCGILTSWNGFIVGASRVLSVSYTHLDVYKRQNQRKVMRVIYDGIKNGGPVNYDDFEDAERQFRDEECDCVIMACTELSCFKIQ